ncbi:MAG: 4-hydroxy-tetrahydrodipicolinate synthase [Pseudoflavonifractor sp.]|nr:4-hydroxy-tetrahydrodipicolinate synthase [Pseudoflavonifractor sp.]
MFAPKGIIPPIVTPFNREGKIDFQVYRQMVDHLIDEGVHGVFPMGTTGEFYAVSDEEYRELLEVTVEQVAGRVDVYAGANAITTRGVIHQMRIAEQVKGIDALSVLTPMFVTQTQEELYQHYKTVADSTDMPIVLYNNKPKTNVTIEPGTVARLAELPNVVAVKDSTGDFTNTMEYLRLTHGIKDFCVLVGRDTLIFAGLCCGATGSIASCANVAPRLVSDIYDKFMAGDRAGSLEAQMKLNPLRLACSMGTFPAVIKEGLVMEGYPVGKCLEPIGELRADEKEKLRRVLIDLELVKE